jgi:hypothetical protein
MSINASEMPRPAPVHERNLRARGRRLHYASTFREQEVVNGRVTNRAVNMLAQIPMVVAESLHEDGADNGMAPRSRS